MIKNFYEHKDSKSIIEIYNYFNQSRYPFGNDDRTLQNRIARIFDAQIRNELEDDAFKYFISDALIPHINFARYIDLLCNEAYLSNNNLISYRVLDYIVDYILCKEV
jgi:hypothetical protein